ncbi:hypothetical protein GCM10007170_44430 [Arthrobacter liuii]|uniref:Uncharacterized protein n=1 Tax=Arthrobacter liuii TaxID=1476996 RepID=A0ABQ2AYU0_9MICC|nr:hypothetical protein GCM10007170_44430 [Arthrobacter liuii]
MVAMIVFRLSGWNGCVAMSGSGAKPNIRTRLAAHSMRSAESPPTGVSARVTVTKLPSPWKMAPLVPINAPHDVGVVANDDVCPGVDRGVGGRSVPQTPSLAAESPKGLAHDRGNPGAAR